MYTTTKNARLAALRSSERRRREDEAPRLRLVVPRLSRLRIDIVEHSPVATVKYTKHVIVDRAPALFTFLCGDPRCAEGGHELTAEILRELRQAVGEATGSHQCDGAAGSAPCGRHIEYVLEADYSQGSDHS